MKAHETALHEMLQLSEAQRNLVFIILLEAGHLDFPKLSEMYMEYLRDQRGTLQGLVDRMAAYLGRAVQDAEQLPKDSVYLLLHEGGTFAGTPFGTFLQQQAIRIRGNQNLDNQ